MTGFTANACSGRMYWLLASGTTVHGSSTYTLSARLKTTVRLWPAPVPSVMVIVCPARSVNTTDGGWPGIGS